MHEIKELVRAKRIPLLRFERRVGEPLKIFVEKATFQSRYVALSHVWTGGLGNPRQNALYQCQLEEIMRSGKRIRRVVESSRRPSFIKLFQTMYRLFMLHDINLFWIDTLCIPVRVYDSQHKETKDSEELRAAAIDRMTQIYAGAHSVLILDPEMRELPTSMASDAPDEFFGRLVRSDWMRRCWTYQEGAMGGKLFVLLQPDPAYLSRERYEIINSVSSSTRLRELTKWLDLPTPPRFVTDFPSGRYIIGDDPSTFVEVWNNLTARTTTRDHDRFLIFALMVNLVPGRLMKIEDVSKRLLTIFNSLESLPIDLIYQPTSFNQPCWLPQKISDRLSWGTWYLKRKEFDDRKLRLTRSESSQSNAIEPSLYLISTKRFLESRGPQGYTFVISTSSGERELCLQAHSLDRLCRVEHTKLALIVKDKKCFDTSSEPSIDTTAALFGVDSETEDCYTLRLLYSVKCNLILSSVHQNITSLGLDLLVHIEKEFDIFCGETNAFYLHL